MRCFVLLTEFQILTIWSKFFLTVSFVFKTFLFRRNFRDVKILYRVKKLIQLCLKKQNKTLAVLFRNWCKNKKFNLLRSLSILIMRWYFINLTILFSFFSRVSRKWFVLNDYLSNVYENLMIFTWSLLRKQIVFWYTIARGFMNNFLFNYILFFFFVAFLKIVMNWILSFNSINMFSFSSLLFIIVYLTIT